MNSYFQQIPGLIKYIAVIDRDVNKIPNHLELANSIFKLIRERKRTRLPVADLLISRFI